MQIGPTPRWNPILVKGTPGKLPPIIQRAYLDSFYPGRDGRPVVHNAVIDAGRQSIKTELFAKRLAVRYLELSERFSRPYDDYRGFYAAPTEDQAVKIVWADWLKLIPKSWVDPKRGGKIDRSRHIIRTHWGSELWCVGLDRPQRIEGVPFDFGIPDERANYKPGMWDEHVEPVLIARGGWSRHLGTPDYAGESSEEYKTLVDYAASGNDPEWKRYTWHSSLIIPDAELEKKKRRMTALAYRQEYQAEWVTAPGRAFWEYSIDLHKKSCTLNRALPLRVTCDFNRQHHVWSIAQGEQREGEWFWRFLDQVYEQNATVQDMCNAVSRWIAAHGMQWVMTDPNGLHFYGDYSGNQKRAEADDSVWETITKAFPFATFHYMPNAPISSSLDRANSILRSATGDTNVAIDPKCEMLLGDLEFVRMADLFSASGKTGKRTHAGDGFRYLFDQWEYDEANTESVSLDTLRSAFGRGG